MRGSGISCLSYTYNPTPGAAGMGGNSISNQSTTVVDFSGATFHNTSRDEMYQWAADDLLPAMANAERQQRTSVGV